MTTKTIEVEIRTFLTKDQYHQLIHFFTTHGQFLNEDEQVTYYFDSPHVDSLPIGRPSIGLSPIHPPPDLRIQKNKFYSKVWLKKGKLHDEQREEIEIHLPVEDFDKLEKLFFSLGYSVSIQWFRKRHSFQWQGIDVAVDYTKGYGYILELEKMATEEEKAKVLELLRQKLAELDLPETPKEELERKYAYYKENWSALLEQG